MQLSVSPGSFPSLAAGELSQWRAAITRGNRAFGDGDYAGALHCYHQAREAAAELFGRIGDADTGIAALVIAHHNLADAHERRNEPDAQGAQLCAAHEALCQAMDDPGLNDAWRLAAWRHSRRTYAELTRFAGLHPGAGRVRAALARGAAGPAGGGRPH